ncbi:adenine nucleotide transporter BT1, chloroplastic/mitochondrial [Sesbania bispinosa]|nr:adenine nucleotide transporter BT1, chloroplastic/mitochondrial [Sesbania bispinosa]
MTKGNPTIDEKSDGFFSVCNLGSQDGYYHPGGLFASVGQMGMGFGVQPNPPNPSDSRDNGGLKLPFNEFYVKYVQPLGKVEIFGVQEEGVKTKKKRWPYTQNQIRILRSGDCLVAQLLGLFLALLWHPWRLLGLI